MADNIFDIENGILIKYNPDGGDTAEVPEGVTEINEYAFAECAMLRRIVIPSGVKKIGQYAFMGCAELRELSLPKGLESIGRFAMWECGSLESLTIPEGLKSIGNSAFRGCDMLGTVMLPDSLERIGGSAFSDCASLEHINIPKNLKMISKRLFSDCQSLVALDLPEGIAELDDYAFECCGFLSHLGLPKSLKKIGKHAFSGCSSLSVLDIPEGVESIGSSAFYKAPLIDDFPGDFVIVGDGILIRYKGTGETAEVPGNVKTIGERSFAYSDTLKSVHIPEGVTEVCDYAFERCTALESAGLPQSLKRLGNGAFTDCTELSAIELPQALEQIGSDAFYSTRLLADNNDELTVFGGKYLIRCNSQNEEISVPDNIAVIADGAFLGCDTLKAVRIPDGVTVIGDRAFKWCANLESVNIPSSVKYIGEEAFASSEQLCAEISRGERVVGESAFAGGAALTFCDGKRSFSVTLYNDIGAGCERDLFEFSAEPTPEAFGRLGEYRIPAAICYADCGEPYSGYLKEHIRSAVCMAAERKDNELLNKILSFGYMSEDHTEFCIDYAIENKLLEQQVILMRFKQETFGSKDVGKMVDDKFGL